MAMFFPQLFGIVGERLVFSPEHQYEASEDLLGDRHILEVRRIAFPGLAFVHSQLLNPFIFLASCRTLTNFPLTVYSFIHLYFNSRIARLCEFEYYRIQLGYSEIVRTTARH